MNIPRSIALLCAAVTAFGASAVAVETPAIIPAPLSIEGGEGAFSINAKTRLFVDPSLQASGKFLQTILRDEAGLQLSMVDGTGEAETDNAIIVTSTNAPESLGAEGYLLEVEPKAIQIRARTAAGAFYGAQTLRQLIAPSLASGNTGIDVPSVMIEDQPRFPWRGMHLDVGRHYFPIDFIKRYLDLMALHKMNTFHWHLTEDQGWRLEIMKYPKLTEVGAFRASTPIPADRTQSDGKRYGGFYTQEQAREIVAYAAERHITVVPEIELPGHSVAALASYPALGCTGGPYEVSTTWGIKSDIYCAGNEEVFTFLEDVLTEVMDIFPSKMIHIGGDEAKKDQWEQCPKCQARIEAEGLKNEHELQSYFIRRIEKFLNSHDRQIIGWDEILEGGLAPNATVMSWRGMKGGILAAQQGNNVVMTPREGSYFDYYQSKDRENEPPAIGNFLPLKQVYEFEPVPAELTEAEGARILGSQGNVWTEYINNTDQVEYMAFPRATALSEVLWSPAGARNYDDFMKRLRAFLPVLDALDVNYRPLD